MNGLTKQEKVTLFVFILSLGIGVTGNLFIQDTTRPRNADVQRSEIQLSGMVIYTDVPAPETREQARQRITGKININTAGAAELETLANIGPKLAQSIIEYRQQHGPFTSLDELMNVNRIGNKTLNKIKNSITLK